LDFQHPDSINTVGMDAVDTPGSTVRVAMHANQKRVGRNEACFCGSGKKYKHCHGQLK
jgi:preprotein translocase subunit SecA